MGLIHCDELASALCLVLKLTNNILFAVSPATCEAFVMGTKGGLDPEVMVNAINAGSGRNGGTLTLFTSLCWTDRSVTARQCTFR
jgi:3-hydroxyisobutyrate dehydrogenase-like beta-hydroxyacid dehydrogenase